MAEWVGMECYAVGIGSYGYGFFAGFADLLVNKTAIRKKSKKRQQINNRRATSLMIWYNYKYTDMEMKMDTNNNCDRMDK